jgi:hypothetical protein
MVPRANAAPPPWARRWDHPREYRWNGSQYGNREYWNRWHANDPRWDRSGYYRSTDPNYAKLENRIQNDRAKINEIEPTGRHRKALQWYEDDLANARRALHSEY